jgi:uncharacterized protein YfiM (DUF2279 family)
MVVDSPRRIINRAGCTMGSSRSTEDKAMAPGAMAAAMEAGIMIREARRIARRKGCVRGW